MAAPRLTFLYPTFLRGPLITECGPLRTSLAQRRPRKCMAGFTTSSKHRDEVRQEQLKPTNTPPPQAMNKNRPSTIGATMSTQLPTVGERERHREGRSQESERPVRDSKVGEDKTPPGTPELPPPTEEDLKATEANKPEHPTRQPPGSTPQNPMETVLSMPSPAEERPHDKPPHLQAPPYVHHFDTWSLVQDLSKGGFTHEQTVSLMKAVRGILADNMDLARRGLVSKSDVENETYLFQAACSELRTEVQNNRKSEAEKLRTQRAQLQHEVEILGQRMTQDISNMKDELKGMFDDRKMAARMEQRAMESKIQELNYTITIALNSDAKSDVESVRWVLTRRAAAALGISVIMILSALNYSRYMTLTQEKERTKLTHDMQNSSTQTMADDGSGEQLLASEGVS